MRLQFALKLAKRSILKTESSITGHGLVSMVGCAGTEQKPINHQALSIFCMKFISKRALLLLLLSL